MSKFALEVLARFAAHGSAASRHEIFANDNIAATTSAIGALAGDGYLLALPTAETADPHGGTRFALTAKGKALAGVPVPKSAGVVASVNGKRKRSA